MDIFYNVLLGVFCLQFLERMCENVCPMKPKDLKSPFRWDNRKPLIGDKLLFVPQYYFEHHLFKMPDLSAPELFGRQAPTYIEYCSGNGDWVVEKALQFPEANWISVERRFDRVRKIWSKMKNQQVSNLLIVCGEAEPFTQYYLKEDSIAGCFINFPDPWPKAKHAKHRLFQSAFIQQIQYVMQKDGKLTVATDDPAWAERICDAFAQVQDFPSAFSDPFYVTEWPNYGFSYFDQLWREKGKTIHYLQFTNQKKVYVSVS